MYPKGINTKYAVKTDSFVVESNVHFPTDYNLLWDCVRKSLDTVKVFLKKYPFIKGWRKMEHWRGELKSLMREVGRISSGGGKNKQEKLQQSVLSYLTKSRLLMTKLDLEKDHFPLMDETDLAVLCVLEGYMELTVKHIDLLERRIIKGETIPHAEKMMSIFERYTEWVAKGKFNPSVEFGKKLSITTDQFDLIVHHKVMSDEQDRDTAYFVHTCAWHSTSSTSIVVEIADTVLNKYKRIASMSFDKGHWRAENKALLELEIPTVILPKLGKLNAKDKELENSAKFKSLKNRHSAIESNINELEHRGLDRCPDRGYHHYKTYIALGVCAYNLKKIGKKILSNRLEEALSQKVRKAA